jgi:type VI secretion system protein ImpB
MGTRESAQKRLQKVRPPRVQMTCDVDMGDAIKNKELPFVTGVIGDFGANRAHPPKRLKERSFVSIDSGNFDAVLESVAPCASFQVLNELVPDGGQLQVDLEFRRLEDFRPEAVVRQVAPLRQLLDARTRLADLRNKLAGTDQLEDLLADVLADTDQIERLARSVPTGEK